MLSFQMEAPPPNDLPGMRGQGPLTLDSARPRVYLGHMSRERAEGTKKRDEDEPGQHGGAETMGSELDPDFVPDQSQENPNEKRARSHPEETGS